MSIDTSLRLKSSLVRHRNVLTRAERISLLQTQDRWQDESTALGLPKVGNRKVKAAKKKSKAEEAAAGQAAAPAGKAAPAAKAAPAGKAAPGGKAPAGGKK